MKPIAPRVSRFLLLILFWNSFGFAAENPSPTPGSTNWTAAVDHRNMMEQLGIKKLRPGPSGRKGATNEANYDVAKANPFPNLPDALTLKNGQKVPTPEMWWK